jgi:epoxyqueuosine reductase
MPILISEAVTALHACAHAEGLSAPHLTAATLPHDTALHLQQYLDKNHHGDMAWLEARVDQRSSPDRLWPAAKTAIVFAQNYGPDMDPMIRLQAKDAGVISVYALNKDYHDLFKAKLKRIAHVLHGHLGADVKVFVDTAALMEKPLAAQAGLGWQGKHTNLVSRNLGSWFFIGTILTTAELPYDAPEIDHCGSCSACLDICPTQAFPAPRQLDARRCISYLTIEHKGHIATEFRKAMGNRIYGCDDCLAVCPWNKFAVAAHEIKLQAREDLRQPKLHDLLQLDDQAFRTLFSGSPVKRTGRDRFIRNCLIAAGNSGEPALVPQVEALLNDASSLVRAMAVWALRQLTSDEHFSALQHHCVPRETDADVTREWSSLQ